MDREQAKPRHLRNAPIAEALIDLRFHRESQVTDEELDLISKSLSDEFPIKEDHHYGVFEHNLSTEDVSSKVTEQGLRGHILRTSDKDRAVQLMRDRLSVSHLRNYDKWESLLDDTKRIWCLFAEVIRPDVITRIAVRYINKLELPVPMDDFEDYLTASPQIPDGLPQSFASYQLRMIVPKNPMVAVVNQVFESVEVDNNGEQKCIPVILDIDITQKITLAPELEGFDGLIGNLRDYKNEWFFRSITEETARMYE